MSDQSLLADHASRTSSSSISQQFLSVPGATNSRRTFDTDQYKMDQIMEAPFGRGTPASGSQSQDTTDRLLSVRASAARGGIFDDASSFNSEVSNTAARRKADDTFTEATSVRKSNLTAWDVAALIMNKMIGTGIFTTPGMVLILAGGKGLSLLLWGIGGAYALLCLSIYLDFGTALPYNGGELVYLNKVWDFSRVKLLPAVIFGGFFITLGHTAGNAIAFARQFVIATDRPDPTKPIQFNRTIIDFYALSILTVVCLMHYFTPRLGLFLNKLTAGFKIMLLFIMACRGIAQRDQPGSGHREGFTFMGLNTTQVLNTTMPSNGTAVNNTISISHPGSYHISGFIYIVYSYGGWENANYVIGDLKFENKSLRIGAFSAVGLVTILYVMLNVGYFMACPTEAITGAQNDLAMTTVFAKRLFGDNTLWISVCTCISAAGNILAVVYTSSKVKQAIALHHFIPLSTFFAADQNGTPGGGLLLHWICSAAVILGIPDTTDAYGFLLGLFSWGQLLVSTFVGFGLPRLAKALRSRKDKEILWKPLITGQKLRYVLGGILGAFNIVIMVFAALPYDPHTIPRRWWPISILGFVCGGSLVYWCLLRVLQTEWSRRWLGWKAEIVEIQESRGSLAKLNRDERRDGTESQFTYEYSGLAALVRRGVGAVVKFGNRFLW